MCCSLYIPVAVLAVQTGLGPVLAITLFVNSSWLLLGVMGMGGLCMYNTER